MRWTTMVTLPGERCEEVIEKIREIACPTSIVVEIEADDLWDARGRLDEMVHEIAAMTGAHIHMSKPVEVVEPPVEVALPSRPRRPRRQ